MGCSFWFARSGHSLTRYFEFAINTHRLRPPDTGGVFALEGTVFCRLYIFAVATVSGVCLDRRQEKLGVCWLVEIDVLLLVHSSRAPLDVLCVAPLSYISPYTTYQVLDVASVGSSSVPSSSVRFSLIVSTAGVARHGSAGRGWALVSRLIRCFLFVSLSPGHTLEHQGERPPKRILLVF